MKIILAGGAGYIGSVLTPLLMDYGYEVKVIDRCWFGNYLPEGTNLVNKNLFDCTREDFAGYDQFIFLAGLSNDPMAEFSPSKNFIHNAALPAYLAFEAKKAGIKRYIYASSCSVYGYTVDQLYTEVSPVICGYPYGISKLQGEQGVLQLNDDKFSVISLRQGTICGFSPRMRMDLIVNTMFKTSMTEGRVTINNPSIWRPILDIRDAASAYIRSIQAYYSISGVFNIASDNYTVGQVGDVVKHESEKQTGKPVKLEIKNIEDYRNYKVSIEKAMTYLGFQPDYKVKDILLDLFEHRDYYGDYEEEKYYNIRVFKNISFQE
ncbi:MAG: SDR family oxidoreductase [Nitrospirae bacterium]|nr:SDR family oxidoreductase [Nitrospirota bacterium]